MPYMIYQQYTTAIKNAYTGHSSVPDFYSAAKAAREWISSLNIDPKLRDPLVEQVSAIEEAFKDLLPDG